MLKYILIFFAFSVYLFIIIYLYYGFRYITKSWYSFNDIRKSSERLNINLYDLADIPEELKTKQFISIISNPTCSPCHKAVNEVIAYSLRKNVPSVCLLGLNEGKESKASKDFRDEFCGKIPIITIDLDQLIRSGFDSAPLYLIVDRNGFILSMGADFVYITNRWESQLIA